MRIKSATDKGEKGALAEVAKQFLRLGFIAYGGPAAHVAMMEEEFVRRRGWVTRERFLDLLGAASLLPGPSSTELAIYLGEIRAGLAGLIVAGACFILPAAFLVAALAWAYLKFGAVPQVAGLLFGIKPVVVALLAQAVWNLGKTALRTVPLAALAAIAVLLAVLGVPAVWLLIGAGFLWMTFRGGKRFAGNRAAFGAWIGLGSGSASGALGALPIFFLLFENWSGPGWQRLRALARSALRPGGEISLAHRFATARRGCGQSGDARPVFHCGHVHRLHPGRMERRGARYTGDVSASICLRRRHFRLLA